MDIIFKSYYKCKFYKCAMRFFPAYFKSLKYLKRLDFTGKFNVLTGHFFIEKNFDILYNNSTT